MNYLIYTKFTPFIGATTLTGNGQTIYISDSALHTAHSSFDGKSITMLDDPVASTTELEHGTHVASIAAGVIGGTTTVLHLMQI